MPTIMDAIRSDHERHRKLLDALAETRGDTDWRRGLFEELHRELGAHTAVEKQLFYGSLLGYEETRAAVARSLEEHEDVRARLEALAAMSFSSPRWLTELEALKEDVERHMDDEEKLFPLAARVLGDERQRELAAAFIREKREIAIEVASRGFEARVE